jgi:hypothetical protein
MVANTDRVKVAFRLTRDKDNYPPADWEHLWAIPRGADHFELDNIPFFAKEVAAGDLITAQPNHDLLVYDRVIQTGGHSTVRVIMYIPTKTAAVRDELLRLGCETEGSHLPNLFAIDVPPGIEYAKVIQLLKNRASQEILDYEEAAIRQ